MTKIFAESDVKQWRPSLIKVTQIGNPDINEGAPTEAFVDPAMISLINEGITRWSKMLNTDEQGGKHPPRLCTTIWLSNGGSLPVVESPGEVNRLRNQAMEIPLPKPRRVP